MPSLVHAALYVALFGAGVLNGLLVTGVFDSPSALPPSAAVVLPQTSSLFAAAADEESQALPAPKTAAKGGDLFVGGAEDGGTTGRPSRGNISDWCYALRPFTQPVGPFLVAFGAANATCARFLAADFAGCESLGDCALQWATAALASVAWQMPLSVSVSKLPRGNNDDEDAALMRSLSRGLPISDALVSQRGLRSVGVRLRGASLEEFVAEAPSSAAGGCGVVYRLQAPLPQLRDLSAARWAFAERLGNAFRREGSTWRFAPDAVAVAVHVARLPHAALTAGTKPVSGQWLQQLVWELASLADTGNFRAPPEPWDGAKTVVFSSGNSYAPIHVYAFADEAADAQWVQTMLPHAATVVAGNSDADTLRHLATADLLVCGNGTLCRAASLHTTRSLALVPTNREPRDFNPCPGDVKCVPDPVALTQELRLHILDVFDRWLIRKSASCPPLWNYPY